MVRTTGSRWREPPVPPGRRCCCCRGCRPRPGRPAGTARWADALQALGVTVSSAPAAAAADLVVVRRARERAARAGPSSCCWTGATRSAACGGPGSRCGPTPPSADPAGPSGSCTRSGPPPRSPMEAPAAGTPAARWSRWSAAAPAARTSASPLAVRWTRPPCAAAGTHRDGDPCCWRAAAGRAGGAPSWSRRGPGRSGAVVKVRALAGRERGPGGAAGAATTRRPRRPGRRRPAPAGAGSARAAVLVRRVGPRGHGRCPTSSARRRPAWPRPAGGGGRAGGRALAEHDADWRPEDVDAPAARCGPSRLGAAAARASPACQACSSTVTSGPGATSSSSGGGFGVIDWETAREPELPLTDLLPLLCLALAAARPRAGPRRRTSCGCARVRRPTAPGCLLGCVTTAAASVSGWTRRGDSPGWPGGTRPPCGW